MNPPQEPAQPRIWQLCLGFATTAVLSALVKAGVIEQLGEHPKTLPELVQTCGLNADVLSRTLRFAAVIDVVTLDGSSTPSPTWAGCCSKMCLAVSPCSWCGWAVSTDRTPGTISLIPRTPATML